LCPVMLASSSLKTLFVIFLICSSIIGFGSLSAEEGEVMSTCVGPFSNGEQPTQKQLTQILGEHKNWIKSNKQEGARAILCEANLSRANLSGANLAQANLSRAVLYQADLTRADLRGANLQKSILIDAILPTQLDRTRRRISSKGISPLNAANLKEADISGVDLDGVAFPLKPGGIPLIHSFAFANNLEGLFYVEPPHSLVEIRNGLKKAGMREQERILTYVIKHGQLEQSWQTATTWDQKLGLYISWVLFEFTCEWGKSPFRPLWILGNLILLFSLPYMCIVFVRGRQELAMVKQPGWDWGKTRDFFREEPEQKKKGGIWAVWPSDSILSEKDQKRVTYVTPSFLFPALQKCKRLQTPILKATLRFFCIILIGLYFSFVSAFHFGWKDLNVGSWLGRIQTRDFQLRGTRWVRTLSGLQSLASVYLLALWALTYFGRPFE
jgi:pentapeptide repeat protein